MLDTDRLFATAHFLGPESDLWEFSDAVMHWDCYAVWEHRPRFARMYFEATREQNALNPYWQIVYDDDLVLVATNPRRLVRKVSLTLANTGSEFHINLDDWREWLNGDWIKTCQHPIEREALAAVIPLLQAKLPNTEQVIAAAGMTNLDSDLDIESGLVGRISWEMACKDLANRAATKGIKCPHCLNFSTDYDYVQVEQISESGPQSYLRCRKCNKKFGP